MVGWFWVLVGSLVPGCWKILCLGRVGRSRIFLPLWFEATTPYHLSHSSFMIVSSAIFSSDIHSPAHCTCTQLSIHPLLLPEFTLIVLHVTPHLHHFNSHTSPSLEKVPEMPSQSHTASLAAFLSFFAFSNATQKNLRLPIIFQSCPDSKGEIDDVMNPILHSSWLCREIWGGHFPKSP